MNAKNNQQMLKADDDMNGEMPVPSLREGLSPLPHLLSPPRLVVSYVEV